MKLFPQLHRLFIGFFDGDHLAIDVQQFFKSGVSFIRHKNIAIGSDLLKTIVFLPS